LSLFAFFGFTIGAGLVEETGSTGFFLDRLVDIWTPVAAGLISGVVWASWHIPLFLMDGYFGQASIQPIVWRYFATFVFLETLYAWIYDNTERSVLAAVLFHLMINLPGEVLAPSQTVRWYTFYLLIAVTVVVAIWRRRSTLPETV
jgi:membrane protease YdiL (CAAX protease family)